MADIEKKFKVYLVPNTHSDLQYLKSYKEYLPIHLSNLKEGLDMLEKYPEYTYLTEHIALLEEFWRRFPNYRTKIKKFALNGRLEISPNFYCISDTNIPSGESLIQQIYYGKRWTKKYLGTETRSAWIADVFGLNCQMPQILKGSGYFHCAFVRGIDNPERKSEFIWQGLDKTEILTTHLVCGYGGTGPFSGNMERDLAKIKSCIENLKKHSVCSKILLGNGGDFVKPSPLSLSIVKKWNKANKDKIVFSTPSKYFVDLLREKPNLEIFKGELNPLFQGCYSSRIKIKQKNRFLENKIGMAERLSVFTSIFAGIPYPFEKLHKAWKKILFFQFHDSICGTVCDLAYKEILKGHKQAEEILDEVIDKNLNSLSKKIKGLGKKIMVFNPSSWERKDLVKIEGKNLCIQDENGKLFPTQEIKEDKKSYLISIVSLPSLCHKTFNLTSKKENFPSYFKVNGQYIETEFYKIKLNKSGTIGSLISKENNFEYVDPEKPFFNNIVVQDDNGDLWLLYESPLVDSFGWGFAQDNWPDPIPFKPRFSKSGKKQVGFFIHSKDRENKIEIIEKGPVRFAIKVEGILSFIRINIKFVQYIYLYNDLKRIDFKTEILPSGKRYRIRVCFPSSIRDGKIYHEIPFGYIQRPQGEFPAQNWVAYGNEKRGLVLLNQGLPGNNVDNGMIILSLMRSVAMEYKTSSETAYEENVLHSFNYSLIPYSEKDFALFTKEGFDFNNPLLIWKLSSIRKKLPQETNLLKIFPENIILSCLRKVEGGILLRVYEAEGKECKARIEFSKELKIEKVQETDLLGRAKKIIKVNGNVLEFVCSPFQIKTFKISLNISS